MPNGKIHDHPITDLLVHGLHPFPAEMEALIRKIHAVNPSSLLSLGMEPFDWEQDLNLEQGMEKLRSILEASLQN
ncbi:MAG TPA: hypothetical protein VIS10_02395 [Anaerolineales bacterium]